MRQRIGRRLISIMLSVLMLVSLLPTAVFAEELPDQSTAGVIEQVGEGTGNTVEDSTENKDSTGEEETKGESSTPYVAKVGDNEYATLKAAIAAAQVDETVILLADLDLSAEGLTIAEDKAVTLDLNGKTLKVANTNSGNIKVLGKLTLQDCTDTAKNGTGTGKVWTATPYISGKQDKVLIAAIDGGTFIMESGLIDAASSIADNTNYGQFAVSVQNENADATVIINGGCIKAGWYAIAGNGQDTTYNGNITVNGGILESTADYAIYHPHSGTTTINGGVVFGAAGGISLNRGKLIVNGGTITSKDTGTTGNWGDGTGNQSAAAINVNAQYGSASVEIKGGKITAEKDAILLTNGKDGTISVSGGTFSSEVKEEYCATGYIPTANADGTYGVKAKADAYVATVGNGKYETLQEAINAAKGGSTVRLLANVTLTETAVFPAGKTVHLNLVGHNITATGTALLINGKTDIQSTGGVGTIESTGNVAVAVGNNASLTVYSGTLKGREGAVITGTSTGATIEIRGIRAKLIATDNAVIAGNGSKRDGNPNTIKVMKGTLEGGIETTGYIACGIYAPWNDNVTVSGGTFNITNGAGIVARAGTVKVTGGTFNCTGTAEGYVGDSKNKVPCAALVFDEAASYPALMPDSKILVSGGSFSTDPAANGATLATGYVATPDENGMYKVGKSNPAAEINGVKYDTLSQAIAALEEKGGTIKLLQDINAPSVNYRITENITIDLNGHNITGNGAEGVFYVYTSGHLTITGNGVITAVENNKAAIAVQVFSEKAKVTLEGGTYKQRITNTNDPHFDLIYVYYGTAEIKGGTYQGATPDWTLNCKDEYYQSKEANIEVTGGTFQNFDPMNNQAEGVGTSFVAAGVGVDYVDGKFTAKSGMIAQVVDADGKSVKAFEKLSEAIEAAKDGDTVKLLADATEDVTIDKSITLDLGGKTLTNTNAGKATVTIAKGATAIVKNGNVKGGDSYYDIQNNGTATFEGVIATGNNVASLVDNFGTLTIKSGSYTGGLDTIKNEPGATLTITGGDFTLEKGTSNGFTGVVFNYGTLTITGGTFTQADKNAPYGQAQVIHTDKSGATAPSTKIEGGTFENLYTAKQAMVVRETNAAAGATQVSGGTFNKQVSESYCADGFIPTEKNADGTYGVKEGTYVAKSATTKKKYDTLQAAIKATSKGNTVTLLADVNENVEIKATKKLTLDLNGYTLNGGTGTAKAALTNYGTITIKDSSADKTGTIKRDDNGTVGEISYYVINNKGTMTIESGTVINNSGYRKTNPTGSMIGSSLICNGDCDEGGTLTIKGGTFTQNNFIAIKNGALGVLRVTGGTITSNHSAIQNWFKADITGGEIRGQLWTDAYIADESVGETKIGGDAKFTGEIVMDIYGSVAPTLEITGGNLNVTNWRITRAAAKAGAKPAISGGTFNAPVKPEYCAANHEPVKNADGTYGVKLFYVAKIDGEEYKTLQEAFDAVSAAGTIELLHDVTVTKTLTFNKEYNEGPTFLKMNGYTITGDGCRALQIVNGHLQIEGNGTPEEGKNVITSTGIGIASSVIRVGANGGKQNLSIASGVTVKTDCSYGITVFGGGTEFLRVKDSKVISTATHNDDYDGCAIATLGTDTATPASVTVKGSTVTAEDTNAIYMPSGKLLVDNDATVKGLTGIYAKSGNVQIGDAKIYGTGVAKDYSYNGNGGIPTGDALVLDSCGYPNGAPTVNYDGAENAYFESTNAKPIGSYATTGNTKVTGFVDKGTFNKAIDSELLAKDYVCVYNAETKNYGVATTEKCVAKVGDIYYATLQDAIDAAQNRATVVLVNDVDLTKTVVVNKTITLDMGGKKLFNTADLWDNPNKEAANWSLISVRKGGDLTITGNGTFAAKVNDCYAVDVQDGANLTIENGTFVGNIHAVYVFEGTATINGGAYSVQQKFSAEKPDEFVLNCYDANRANGTAVIIVTGGTFQNFDPMNNQAEGKGTSFVNAKKYVGVNAVKKDDGTVSYTAVENMTAQVVDKDGKSVQAYKSLSAALTGATAGQTVKLLKSVTGEKYVEVEANVTLDLNGHDLTGAKLLWVTGTILDSATKKGIVSATKYLLPTNNGYAPVYNSEGDGYSFFELSVYSEKKDNAVLFRLDKSAERAAAVDLMKANVGRVKAVVTISWKDGDTGSGDQSFTFADQKMSSYLADVTEYGFKVSIGGLDKISGTVTAQANFVIYDATGEAIYAISGSSWTIQE